MLKPKLTTLKKTNSLLLVFIITLCYMVAAKWEDREEHLVGRLSRSIHWFLSLTTLHLMARCTSLHLWMSGQQDHQRRFLGFRDFDFKRGLCHNICRNIHCFQVLMKFIHSLSWSLTNKNLCYWGPVCCSIFVWALCLWSRNFRWTDSSVQWPKYRWRKPQIKEKERHQNAQRGQNRKHM